jgi:hypothetical protein
VLQESAVQLTPSSQVGGVPGMHALASSSQTSPPPQKVPPSQTTGVPGSHRPVVRLQVSSPLQNEASRHSSLLLQAVGGSPQSARRKLQMRVLKSKLPVVS